MSTIHILEALYQSQVSLNELVKNEETISQISQVADCMAASLSQGGKILSCGNGGSCCDAMHFAEELTGRFRQNRKALAAIAMSDPSHITCVANDFGFEYIYSKYIEAHGKKGDVLLAISTSGKSPNIIEAAKKAKELGVTVVGMTGKPNCPLSEYTDFNICTPSGYFSDRVQELHIKVIHIMIELIERKLCSENYK